MRQNDSIRLRQFAENLAVSGEERRLLNTMRKSVIHLVTDKLIVLSKKQNPHGIKVGPQFPTGSLDRDTAVRGASDSDVVLPLSWTPPLGGGQPPTPKHIINLIAKLVPSGQYHVLPKKRSIQVTSRSSPNPHVQSRGIIGVLNQVTIPNTVSLDLVPMLIRMTPAGRPSSWWYAMDRRETSQMWIKMNPKMQRDMFRRLAKREDAVPLVRLVKSWRRTFRNPRSHLPSYLMETLVWVEFWRNPNPVPHLAVRFNRVLQSLKQVLNPGINLSMPPFNLNTKPKGKPIAKGIPLIHDPANLANNLVLNLAKADLEWWAEQAESDAAENRTFDQVFPNVGGS